MTMSIEQAATPTKSFWRTWRREIVRGGVLFGLVVGAGLFIRSVRIHVPSPLSALGAFGDFNWGDGDGGDLFGRGRNVGDPWEYHTLLKPTQRVWIRNTNGPIDVVAGTSDSLVIQAEKSWHMSDPQSVQLIPVLTERGLTVCAVWEARDSRCNDGGDYKMNGVKKSDVAVRFTVQLPRNVPVDASTVNGGLQIDGVSAPVQAATVNGRIAVSTSTGPVQATTVNGSIEAVMQSLTSGDVRLTTVNGSVSAGLPRQLNAEIDAETVNGRVETDFPVRVSGKISPRHLRGTIGNGGPTLKLLTVNGSITLHEAAAEERRTIAPRPPRMPHGRVRPVPATPAPPAPPPEKP
jgi:Putative adhesin